GDLAANGPQGTQNPSTSAEWFLNSTNANASAVYTDPVVAPPGSLAQTFATDQSVLAYFAPSGSPQALTNVGDTLIASFTFTVSGASNSADGIRVALLNSSASQITTNTDITAGNFLQYTGFAAFFNPSNTATTLNRRNQDQDSILIASTSIAYSSLGAPVTTGSAFALGSSTYTGALSLTYEGSGQTLVTFSLSDTMSASQAGYTILSASSPTTSFDTFVLGGLSGAATSLTLSNVDVVFVPVPEPPVYILCAGGLAVLAGAHRWRRLRRESLVPPALSRSRET
ncbi:MAG TPA: hypothetical protein VMI53_11605, partial [Opitutaceae bacterium]|nr:hypothetical protein [Opitutaceae bacterium]